METTALAASLTSAGLEELLDVLTGRRAELPPDLDALAALDPPELALRLGVEDEGARRLAAAFELGRRRERARRAVRPLLDAPASVYAYASPVFRDLRVEVFRALVLDARHRLVADEVVSQGVLTASLVHPREVFRPVLVRSGAAVVVVHNHPSGDPTPSAEDDRVTERLRRAGEILGASLLDHVVVGAEGYWSYRERGLLAGPAPGVEVRTDEETAS